MQQPSSDVHISAPSTSHDDDTKMRFLLSGLRGRVDRAQLEEAFREYGPLSYCYIPTNGHKSGLSRGYAFVELQDQRAARRCLMLEEAGKGTILIPGQHGRRPKLEVASEAATQDNLARFVPAVETATIVVSYLGVNSESIDQEKLLTHFARFGQVGSVEVERDETGPLGMATIRFSSHEDVRRVCQEAHQIDGKNLTVMRAVTEQQLIAAEKLEERRAYEAGKLENARRTALKYGLPGISVRCGPDVVDKDEEDSAAAAAASPPPRKKKMTRYFD